MTRRTFLRGAAAVPLAAAAALVGVRSRTAEGAEIGFEAGTGPTSVRLAINGDRFSLSRTGEIPADNRWHSLWVEATVSRDSPTTILVDRVTSGIDR